MLVYDPSGRQYDATQLTAPAAVNGVQTPAGWWVLTDDFGQRSPCSPPAFEAMFGSSAAGAAAATPPSAMAAPTDQLPWTILLEQNSVAFGANTSQSWTITGANAFRQIAVDVLILSGTGPWTVAVARMWDQTGDAYTMDTQSGILPGSSYSQDFGEQSHSGRLLGAPILKVTVTNTAAAAAGFAALTIAGR